MGCHRPVTAVQQRASMMLARTCATCGRSRWINGRRTPPQAVLMAQGGGGKSVVPRAPGGIRGAGVVLRMPPFGVASPELPGQRGLGRRAAGWVEPGGEGWVSAGRREGAASIDTTGRSRAAPGTLTRAHALTVTHDPGRVTFPSERPPKALRHLKETFRHLQCVRNSPSEHPAPTPAVVVCARSLLENGIVIAKSQCGRSRLDAVAKSMH